MVLAVQDENVRLINRSLFVNLDLGHYVSEARHLVPDTEAPVRDLRTVTGWRIIASAYLDHVHSAARTRLRFFGPDGRIRRTEQVLELVERTDIGTLFGGVDEIFAITSNEEHVYNDETRVWLLPAQGKPVLLLSVAGAYSQFSGDPNVAPSLTVGRQRYDGVHAETKGIEREFYFWDSARKVLMLRPAKSGK
ncbi:MAG TPA: hypothetical protein VMI94_14815 [Bryobacteraceae bacterium]|nr:hypothetical protein [Bryobacteraceae bacterium]